MEHKPWPVPERASRREQDARPEIRTPSRAQKHHQIGGIAGRHPVQLARHQHVQETRLMLMSIGHRTLAALCGTPTARDVQDLRRNP